MQITRKLNNSKNNNFLISEKKSLDLAPQSEIVLKLNKNSNNLKEQLLNNLKEEQIISNNNNLITSNFSQNIVNHQNFLNSTVTSSQSGSTFTSLFNTSTFSPMTATDSLIYSSKQNVDFNLLNINKQLISNSTVKIKYFDFK